MAAAVGAIAVICTAAEPTGTIGTIGITVTTATAGMVRASTFTSADTGMPIVITGITTTAE